MLKLAPGLPVIVITAYATIETAVEAMRRGAFDFLPKPFTPDELRRVLERVVRIRRLFGHSFLDGLLQTILNVDVIVVGNR